MANKIWVVLNWIFLVIVTLVAVWMIWGFSSGNVTEQKNISLPSGECVDVERLEGFGYEACYDAYSETIFLKVSRKEDNYRVKDLEVSFVDLASQSHTLKDVPGAGEDTAYRITANKNPKSIAVKLNVVRDFVGAVCSSNGVFVEYCPTGTNAQGVNVSINPIGGVRLVDFIEVSDLEDFGSDTVVMDLVEKEAIWESACKSEWDCDDWESCDGEFQHRECRDIKSCAVPIDSPATVRRCDGSCIEDWECTWSGCENGFSVPVCNDLNGCGTSYDIPNKLACEDSGSCVPDVSCGEWTDCDVDYNFVDLVGRDEITQIDGGRSRLCVDKKGCIATQKEEESCSVGVDIYTKRFEKCGDDFVGVYNVLDDSTLAILKEGGGKDSYLDIYFDDQSGVYCDYCFDGVMNGDETGVDCGGSCPVCVRAVYDKGNWWDFLW